MTTSYNGFVSRLAYLEAQRQEALELAEAEEHLWGEDNQQVKDLRAGAVRVLEEIQEGANDNGH